MYADGGSTLSPRRIRAVSTNSLTYIRDTKFKRREKRREKIRDIRNTKYETREEIREKIGEKREER